MTAAGSLPSSSDYLETIDAEFYLNDVVSMILNTQPERPLEFMHEYFKTVNDMEHVVSKRFEYINATAHNRRAFLFACTRAFGHFGEGQEVAIGDLYQLVTMLCPNYPEARIYEIPRLLRSDPSARIPFGDLRVAFSVHFAYYDFLLDLKHIFCQISRSSDTKAGEGSQGRRRLGWHAVDLAAVEARTDEYAARIKGKPLSCVPSKFIRQAYGDDLTLTFDEVRALKCCLRAVCLSSIPHGCVCACNLSTQPLSACNARTDNTTVVCLQHANRRHPDGH